MAGKCKEMNKIKQVLRLHLDGESNRSIGINWTCIRVWSTSTSLWLSLVG